MQSKQGGTAESYFTDPVLVDNTQGQGRFSLEIPVPQRERVFFMPPAPGKELTTMKNMNMISRRSFLKAAMAASAVSALALTGCGGAASSASSV